MDSTDADEENICNSSFGREVMQTVTSNDSHHKSARRVSKVCQLRKIITSFLMLLTVLSKSS